MALIQWTEGSANDWQEPAKLAAQIAAIAFDPNYQEAWSEQQIASLLQASYGWLDLAWVEGKVTAFALNRLIFDEVELLLCAVAPSSRRTGIGTALINRVADQSVQKGANRVFLEVRDTNVSAINVYKRAGFIPLGRRQGYYSTLDGQSVDALTLSLDLTNFFTT